MTESFPHFRTHRNNAYSSYKEPQVPLFGEEEDSRPNAMCCPACGEQELHHYRVDVFEPDKEDSKTGLHSSITSKSVATDGNLNGNPSARRHGLAIHFWCEQCLALSVLSLAQHKGQSNLDFRVEGYRSFDNKE